MKNWAYIHKEGCLLHEVTESGLVDLGVTLRIGWIPVQTDKVLGRASGLDRVTRFLMTFGSINYQKLVSDTVPLTVAQSWPWGNQVGGKNRDKL